MRQLTLNFDHCIMDKIRFPKNDSWIYELKEKRERYEKMLETIKTLREIKKF